jgi:crystallin alpha B
VSQLSSDGVLTISAPKKALPESANEKVIPITQTQSPALKPDSAKAGEAQKMES